MARVFFGYPVNYPGYCLLLFFALVLIVIGTAMLWNVSDNLRTSSSYSMHRFNWECVQFYLVWLFAALSLAFARHFFSAVAAGLATFLCLYNVNNMLSIAVINACREQNTVDSTSFTHRCTAGGIIAYTGLGLSLWAALAPLAVAGTGLLAGFILALADGLFGFLSIATVIAGCIILWISDAAIAPDPATLVLSPPTIYTLTIDIGVLAIASTIFTWWSFTNVSIVIRGFATFLSAYAFNMIFYWMFLIHEGSPQLGDGMDGDWHVYAGCLLCWFATFCNMMSSCVFFYGYIAP